jgi:hypothetical protein
MKLNKIIIVTVCVLILALGYWLLSPLWRNTRLNEEAPIIDITTATVSSTDTTITQKDAVVSPSALITKASGVFKGFDKLHNGSGTVNLISNSKESYIRFESDFNVTNGPDLYVGFGKDGKYIESAELARLKGNQGSQNYLLPSTVDFSQYNEVWIWCKAFSVPFARAVLK